MYGSGKLKFIFSRTAVTKEIIVKKKVQYTIITTNNSWVKAADK